MNGGGPLRPLLTLLGVHSGYRVGFGRVLFDSVVFRMRVAMGNTRVGSICHGSVEDRLFELSG